MLGVEGLGTATHASRLDQTGSKPLQFSCTGAAPAAVEGPPAAPPKPEPGRQRTWRPFHVAGLSSQAAKYVNSDEAVKPRPVAPRPTKFKAKTRHKWASSGEGLGLGQAAPGTNLGAPACHTKGKRQQPPPSAAPGKTALRLKGGGLVWEVEHAGPTRCVKTGPARSTLQRRGVADTESADGQG